MFFFTCHLLCICLYYTDLHSADRVHAGFCTKQQFTETPFRTALLFLQYEDGSEFSVMLSHAAVLDFGLIVILRCLWLLDLQPSLTSICSIRSCEG